MSILISTQRGGGKRRDNKSFDLHFDFLASFFILRFSFDSEHLRTRATILGCLWSYGRAPRLQADGSRQERAWFELKILIRCYTCELTDKEDLCS